MKCKVIRATPSDIQSIINEWLETGDYEISHTSQSQINDSSYIVLIIFYYDLKGLRKAKIDKINGN